MSWRKEQDPRKVFALETLCRLMTEGMGSGDAGNINIEKLAYWKNGLGTFEAARSVKTDLNKVGKP